MLHNRILASTQLGLSLFGARRGLHNRLPTDENLTDRGLSFPSLCTLCMSQQETSQHLFFDCPFALKLWNWLQAIVNCQLSLSVNDIWNICNRGWSPQCHIVILSAIINVIDSIWYARNQGRFNNSKVPWQTAISLVYSNVSLSGNNKKAAFTSVRDFQIMKEFKVVLLRWFCGIPPIANWIKCNIDGAALGSPGQSSCGGLFRDSSGDCIGCFAENLGFRRISMLS